MFPSERCETMPPISVYFVASVPFFVPRFVSGQHPLKREKLLSLDDDA